ncbi:MAG: glycine cleavage system aminomethyltransferase GcvT [Solirubrobacterales bacterium]|nr:glycine cleavage system aminomethyltransferase GcvT [Solirubrobacterales bacterium]
MTGSGGSGLTPSPIADRHLRAGAKMTPFAGWEMPIQYAGIGAEHEAVRTDAGIFDVSHMGQLVIEGSDALPFLQRMLSNDVSKLEVGGAQYGLTCGTDGGVVDDLFTYRLGESRYLTVTNAGNHRKDLSHFSGVARKFDVTVTDAVAAFAMFAVQGPHARTLVDRLADEPLPPRMRVRQMTLAGAELIVCGTGYTGEDGVELLIDPQVAGQVWDALVEAGVRPAGLGARDTLRLEACFHLYGNDMDESRNPIEAGLGWCCKEDTGFIGADSVRRARELGTDELLVPFRIQGRGIARSGDQVIGGGTVTSGTMSPSLGIGIGMAYLPRDRTGEGEPFQISVRGKTRSAEVASKPLYTSGGAQS